MKPFLLLSNLDLMPILPDQVYSGFNAAGGLGLFFSITELSRDPYEGASERKNVNVLQEIKEALFSENGILYFKL